MPSNAEILAQLEKLSKQMPVIKVLKEPLPVVPRQHGAQFPRSHELENVDVPAILAAFKRLVKIEEAARAHVDKRRDAWVAAVARGYDEAFATEHWPTVGVFEEGVDALDAALTAYRATQTKEPRDEAK